MWAVIKRLMIVGCVTGMGLALLPMTACAQTTFEFNKQSRLFKACRLLVPYQAGGAWTLQASDAQSLIFEGMRRYPGKPAGWDLYNPLAARPDLLKSQAAYWEVPLDPVTLQPAAIDAQTGACAALPQLHQMDLIYISAGDITLNLIQPDWREALIRAVREGAVLWINQQRVGNGLSVVQFAPPGRLFPWSPPLPPPPFDFQAGAQTQGAFRRAYDGIGNISDRLLQYPFRLEDWREVQYLGMLPAQLNVNTASANPVPDTPEESASLDFVRLNEPSFRPVVGVWDGSDWQPNIAVARLGAGAIVLTAGDVGYDIVNWWLGAHRNKPLRWEEADCKFAWNVLALVQDFAEAGGSATARSASPNFIPPPLNIQWQFPARTVPTGALELGPVVSTPAVGRRLTFVLSNPFQGANIPARLCAFDSEPARDLDGDGNADDGVPDYALGADYDLVWAQDLDLLPRWTSPTVATRNGVEVVLVSLTREVGSGSQGVTGEVRCYRADIGALLWTRPISPYGNGNVVDLSTPTVYGDWVFVLASEYGENADSGSGYEDTYGRAHCFQLSYNWAADQNGPQWIYPSSSTNPNGDADQTGGNPDNATPENPRTLPPFQDPAWVADPNRPLLPPFPTPKPTVSEPDPPSAQAGIEVLLHCVSPISLRWNETNRQVDNDNSVGGCEIILIPTPQDSSGTDWLNVRAFRVLLPGARRLYGPGGNPLVQIRNMEIRRADNQNITATVTGLWEDPVDGRVYAYLRSGEAREFALPSLAVPAPNWLQLAQGAAIGTSVGATQPGIWYRVDTDEDGDFSDEVDMYAAAEVPGPIYQVFSTGGPNQRRAAPSTVIKGLSLVLPDAVDVNGNLRHNNYVTATTTSDPVGQLQAVEQATGERKWAVRLLQAGVVSQGALQQLVGRSGVAVEPSTNTAVAAVAAAENPDNNNRLAVRPALVGLNIEPRLVIQLRGGGPNAQLRAGAPVTVQTLNASYLGIATVPTAAYTVDAVSKTITFDANFEDATVGSLGGKPVWVTYTRTDPNNPDNPANDVVESNELHILPDNVRFVYTTWTIRLRQRIVRADANLEFRLPNGIPLTRTETIYDSPTIPAGTLPALPAAGWGAIFALPVLQVSHLQMPGGERLRPGSEFIVTYEYLDPVTLTPQLAHERHQVPVNFGLPISSPALAGYTVHVGTDGYRPTGLGAAAPLLNPELFHGVPPQPEPALDPTQLRGYNKAFLSVVLDPVAGIARGALSEVALRNEMDLIPQLRSSPAVDGEGLIVGSSLNSPATGYSRGFVSRLAPQRTLICDNTRLVEVIGQNVNWICVGSQAAHYHEGLDPLNLGAEELRTTPFKRPGKAIYLPNGNILVADTGNNRVIEIDRQGRQVWPLDIHGYDYYTSTPALNPNLQLSRPADCFRYYETRVGNTVYCSPHGDMLPGTITHTVIADTGNARVIDVITEVTPLGVQRHRVEVLTPSRVRLAQGMTKISYTRAIPIFDPISTAVIGYLCAAANLHQLVVVEAGTKRVDPPSAQQPARGTAGTNWKWLAWLYDDNVDDTNYAPTNPLIFKNIRDVQLAREGGRLYLTVTCGQYGGRLNQQGRHWLSYHGAGVFEFALDISGAPGTWTRLNATDIAGGAPVSADDPIWQFTQLDYTYSSYTMDYSTGQLTSGTRRSLTNILYRDPADNIDKWLEMPWQPVSCQRLAGDISVGSNRLSVRHMITNYAELIQNLRRDNIEARSAPAMLSSSVFVVDTDTVADAAPENDVHELDRREVIPNPHEPDWTDPLNQPAYAYRR